MSDLGPDLPDFLVDAILDEGPPAEAVDLVKQAFSWRTIDADLMEISFDSARESAGVRDEAATRSFEFTSDGLTVVVEVDGPRVTGSLTPAEDGTVTLVGLQESTTTDLVVDGLFQFDDVPAEPAYLEFALASRTLRSPTISLG